tara:strand:+ start:1416 stop:1712 length:297 start_codon:yes stop_codon:yes gene_type:complete
MPKQDTGSEKMWKNILQKGIKKRRWHAIVDKVMSDGKVRSASEVKDSMFDYVVNAARRRNINLPNTTSVGHYLSFSKDDAGDKKYEIVSKKPFKYVKR